MRNTPGRNGAIDACQRPQESTVHDRYRTQTKNQSEIDDDQTSQDGRIENIESIEQIKYATSTSRKIGDRRVSRKGADDRTLSWLRIYCQGVDGSHSRSS